ncbi:hypothetical protein ACIRP3_42360 [Streptomyces sp. NPDC101209]
MRRWVLQEQAWTTLLKETGFTRITSIVLPATAEGARTTEPLPVKAYHAS